MTRETRVNAAPFIFADVCLLAVAAVVIFKGPAPLTFGAGLIATGAVALGGVLAVLPWLLRHSAEVKLAETDSLGTAVDRIQDVETVADKIGAATGQWQTVQEHAAQTVAASREIAEQITTEAKAFSEFMQKANDSEKAHLRLEVEKLRRAEADWLQVLVVTLDHVFALHRGALNSGQPSLVEQIGNFQKACRDAARRVGLAPFTANRSEPFDSQVHEIYGANAEPPERGTVAETVATGYRFQGQLVRRALVVLDQERPPENAPAPDETGEQPPASHAAPAPKDQDLLL